MSGCVCLCVVCVCVYAGSHGSMLLFVYELPPAYKVQKYGCGCVSVGEQEVGHGRDGRVAHHRHSSTEGNLPTTEGSSKRVTSTKRHDHILAKDPVGALHKPLAILERRSRASETNAFN